MFWPAAEARDDCQNAARCVHSELVIETSAPGFKQVIAARPRSDVEFMQRALELSAAARANGEVPVGAVLVLGDQIIAEGANRPIASNDPTAHAEIEALRAGGQALGSYRLTDTTLYVTLEPCVMCASAIVHARVRRLVFGAWDPRAGAAGSIVNVFSLPGLNHRVDVFGGVLADECAERLKEFFAERRGGSN
jgi:tRNA(adenine34) deaminase